MKPETVDRIIQDVAELGDRTSPENWPDAMLVTGAELRLIIERNAAEEKSPREIMIRRNNTLQVPYHCPAPCLPPFREEPCPGHIASVQVSEKEVYVASGFRNDPEVLFSTEAWKAAIQAWCELTDQHLVETPYETHSIRTCKLHDDCGLAEQAARNMGMSRPLHVAIPAPGPTEPPKV